MSKCPDCNAEIYGSTYCVFCDWGKSAGISRLDALRTENEKLRARCEAYQKLVEAQWKLIACIARIGEVQSALMKNLDLPATQEIEDKLVEYLIAVEEPEKELKIARRELEALFHQPKPGAEG